MACPGVGLVQRGYERMFSDVFNLMSDEFDITLFKGGGPPAPKQIAPPFVRSSGRLVKALPVHKLFGRTPTHTECMTFALGMLPHLMIGDFDLVYTIDPPLTRLLYHLRGLLGLRFRLLHVQGAALSPPSDYPPADHTMHVGRFKMDEALAFGHAAETLTLVPPGIFPERFIKPADRAALRRARGIDEHAFVILSVAAINRFHKRIDYLIDEVAKIEGDPVLLLDGSVGHGDPDLLDYARHKLGDRCRISHVPSDSVWELYALADVMAHVALWESFGMAVVEAAIAGLPVITHNHAHFQWLLPNPNCWIDAEAPGALAAKLTGLMTDRAQLDAMRSSDMMVGRFSWRALKPQYAALFEHVAAMAPRRTGQSGQDRALHGRKAA
jgi:glycosyltransferase involved in cell wall biosynthesis